MERIETVNELYSIKRFKNLELAVIDLENTLEYTNNHNRIIGILVNGVCVFNPAIAFNPTKDNKAHKKNLSIARANRREMRKTGKI